MDFVLSCLSIIHKPSTELAPIKPGLCALLGFLLGLDFSHSPLVVGLFLHFLLESHLGSFAQRLACRLVHEDRVAELVLNEVTEVLLHTVESLVLTRAIGSHSLLDHWLLQS